MKKNTGTVKQKLTKLQQKARARARSDSESANSNYSDCSDYSDYSEYSEYSDCSGCQYFPPLPIRYLDDVDMGYPGWVLAPGQCFPGRRFCTSPTLVASQGFGP
jgi:hypothetical protein